MRLLRLLLLLVPCAALAPGRTVRVAAWQGRAATADVGANVRAVADAVRTCAADGVELVLFPELFLHGYDATRAQLEALALSRDAPELRAVAAAAAAARVCVGVPYCERGADDARL